MSRNIALQVLVLIASGCVCTLAEQNTSMIELVANADSFDGRVVRVIGYVSIGQERNALYLHHEFAQIHLLENAVWIEFPEAADEEVVSRVNNKYCIIEGRFRSKQRGHLGRYAGTILEISRLSVWCLQDGSISDGFERRFDSHGNVVNERPLAAGGGFDSVTIEIDESAEESGR